VAGVPEPVPAAEGGLVQGLKRLRGFAPKLTFRGQCHLLPGLHMPGHLEPLFIQQHAEGSTMDDALTKAPPYHMQSVLGLAWSCWSPVYLPGPFRKRSFEIFPIHLPGPFKNRRCVIMPVSLP